MSYEPIAGLHALQRATARCRENAQLAPSSLAPAGRRWWQFSGRNPVADRPPTLERTTRSTSDRAVVPVVPSLPGDIRFTAATALARISSGRGGVRRGRGGTGALLRRAAAFVRGGVGDLRRLHLLKTSLIKASPCSCALSIAGSLKPILAPFRKHASLGTSGLPVAVF